MINQDLGNGFRVQTISKDIYDEFRRVNEAKIFPNRFDINVQDALSLAEKEAVVNLTKNIGNPHELRLGLFHGQDMIGWHWGTQVSADTYRMVTSGISPDFQRRGLYSAMLPVVAGHLKEKGFQIILSRHYATDNQVIIPKMRFGFLISGFELTDDYGLLLRLCYFFNPTRRKILHVRSGFQQPDEEVRGLIRKYE